MHFSELATMCGQMVNQCRSALIFFCLALGMWTNRIVCIRHNHKYHRIFFISLNWWQKQEPKPFAYFTWATGGLAPASRSITVYSDANNRIWYLIPLIDSNLLRVTICCLCWMRIARWVYIRQKYLSVRTKWFWMRKRHTKRHSSDQQQQLHKHTHTREQEKLLFWIVRCTGLSVHIKFNVSSTHR